MAYAAEQNIRHRLLIVDDHPLVRSGIRSIIQLEPDLEICGEAESQEQALELVERERSVAAAKAAEDAAVATAAGKPVQSAEIVTKRIEGGVQKYLKEVSLFNQTFVKNDKLFMLDFKGTNYIFEYFASKAKNDKMAEENFNIKFKRYLMLLSNHRYHELINSAITSEKNNYNSHKIIIIVPSKNEIKLLKDLQYYEKMQQLNFDIYDVEDLNKIIS